MIPGYEFLYNIDLLPLGFFLLAIALLLRKKWLSSAISCFFVARFSGSPDIICFISTEMPSCQKRRCRAYPRLTPRDVMLQLWDGATKAQTSRDETPLLNLLENPSLSSFMKKELLINITDIPTLVEFTDDADGKVAFTAMKMLWILEPQIAGELADEILADPQEYDSEKVRAAMLAKGIALEETCSASVNKTTSKSLSPAYFTELKDFADFCMNVDYMTLVTTDRP